MPGALEAPHGAWKQGQGCRKQHAMNLPGVIETSNEGDFWCAHCGADIGTKACAPGCCKQRFADLFETEPCEVGGDVDHGCCYHDEPVVDQEVQK